MDTDNSMVVARGKGAKYVVTDLTLGGGHTKQYAGHVSQKCILDTYIILFINVTSIN